MQQHPKQRSYIKQALTHSVLQNKENMTIKNRGEEKFA